MGTELTSPCEDYSFAFQKNPFPQDGYLLFPPEGAMQLSPPSSSEGKDFFQQGINVLQDKVTEIISWGNKAYDCFKIIPFSPPMFYWKHSAPQDRPFAGSMPWLFYCSPPSDTDRKATRQCLEDFWQGMEATVQAAQAIVTDYAQACREYLTCFSGRLLTSQCFELPQKCADYSYTNLMNWWNTTTTGLQQWAEATFNNQDPVAISEKVAEDLYLFYIGDSLQTLAHPQANCFAKAVAAGDVALTFLPWAKASKEVKGIAPFKVNPPSIYAQLRFSVKGKLKVGVARLEDLVMLIYKKEKNDVAAVIWKRILYVAYLRLAFEMMADASFRIEWKKFFTWLGTKKLRNFIAAGIGLSSLEGISENAIQKGVTDWLNGVVSNPYETIALGAKIELRVDPQDASHFSVVVPLPVFYLDFDVPHTYEAGSSYHIRPRIYLRGNQGHLTLEKIELCPENFSPDPVPYPALSHEPSIVGGCHGCADRENLLSQMGKAYEIMGNYPQALSFYHQAIGVAEYDWIKLTLKMGRYEEVITRCEELLDVHPYYAWAQELLGLAYDERGKKRSEAGDWGGAIADAEKAFQVMPKESTHYFSIHHNLVATYEKAALQMFDRYEFQKALEIFLKAEQVAPHNRIILLRLSLVYRTLGNAQKFQEYTARAALED